MFNILAKLSLIFNYCVFYLNKILKKHQKMRYLAKNHDAIQ